MPPPQAELRPASGSAGPGLVLFDSDSDGDSELLGRFRGPAWTRTGPEEPGPGAAAPSPSAGLTTKDVD